MESLYLLIPVSVVLVFLIGLIFWWTLSSGQLDDLEGPAYRILMDDDQAMTPPKHEVEVCAADADDKSMKES